MLTPLSSSRERQVLEQSLMIMAWESYWRYWEVFCFYVFRKIFPVLLPEMLLNLVPLGSSLYIYMCVCVCIHVCICVCVYSYFITVSLMILSKLFLYKFYHIFPWKLAILLIFMLISIRLCRLSHLIFNNLVWTLIHNHVLKVISKSVHCGQCSLT